MNLLIMGPAGAGKGTFSELIEKEYDIPHISSGDMFRAEIGNNTELGLKAKSYMEQGALVPDEVTIGMVKNRILQDDCKKGYLLDGFPRTVNQAKALEELTEQLNLPLQGIIVLTIPYEDLYKRITGRRICTNCGAIFNIYSKPSAVEGICDVCGSPLKQRTDDNEEGLKKRLSEFENETKPVFEYFKDKGIIHEVESTGGIDVVWERIKNVLEGIK